MKYIEINDVPLFDNASASEKDGALVIIVDDTSVDKVSDILTDNVKNNLWRILSFDGDTLKSKFYGYSNIRSITQDGDSVVIVLDKMTADEMTRLVLETIYEFRTGSKARDIVYTDFTMNVDRTILDIIKSDISL